MLLSLYRDLRRFGAAFTILWRQIDPEYPKSLPRRGDSERAYSQIFGSAEIERAECLTVSEEDAERMVFEIFTIAPITRQSFTEVWMHSAFRAPPLRLAWGVIQLLSPLGTIYPMSIPGHKKAGKHDQCFPAGMTSFKSEIRFLERELHPEADDGEFLRIFWEVVNAVSEDRCATH